MSNNASSLPYRPCVGIMLINHAGGIWQGERIDTPGAWQMPQGGIDNEEDLQSAALRELEEETSILKKHVEILSQTQNWLHYDLPENLLGIAWGGRFKGQKMRWFLMRLNAPDDVIDIATSHPEFSRWRWGNIDSLPHEIVPFKRAVYEELQKEFEPLIKASCKR